MHVVELVSPGNLRIGQRDVPTPLEDELLLRVEACGICGHDILQYRGFLSASHSAGVVLGHEIAGCVVARGDAVDSFETGELVACVMGARCCGACDFCREGNETLCYSRLLYGEDLPGGLAEYVTVQATSAVKVPCGLSAEAASIAGCAVGTALHAFEVACVKPGDLVAVTGASGGVGLHALQVAAACGATPIALTSNAKNAQVLSRFADTVVTGVTFDVELRKHRLQPDVILDLTAGITLETSLRAVRRGGCVVVAGNVTSRPAEVLPGAMIYRELRLLGVKGAGRRHLEEALRLLAAGTIVAQTTTFSFQRAQEAFRFVEAGEIYGRAVLSPGV